MSVGDMKILYTQVFGGLSGEKVLRDLERRFWDDTEMFTVNERPETLFYREGQRSVIKFIQRMIKEGKTRV